MGEGLRGGGAGGVREKGGKGMFGEDGGCVENGRPWSSHLRGGFRLVCSDEEGSWR